MIWEEYKMKYNIAVVPGDDIGPKVMDEALKVLEKIGRKYDCEYYEIGRASCRERV